MLQVIFIVLGVLTLACALVVTVSRNLFHSAVFLAFTFIGVAGLYLLLEAEFLAGIQILVYVGAIVTLIVFAIMVSRDLMNPKARTVNRQWGAAAVVAALIFVALVVAVLQVPWGPAAISTQTNLTAALGTAMVGDYLLPFEVISVVLLAALVGSIILARER